ncbi:DUF6087 family protein [Streptomyces albulus]|nr:DUF6087 family protein [Streptomyces noursei]
MDDESLSDWANRRAAKVGRLRAMLIVFGDGPRAAHLNPDAPRAIERWNGHTWEPHGFAANLAEARRILYPDANTDPTPAPPPANPWPRGRASIENQTRPGHPEDQGRPAARRPACSPYPETLRSKLGGDDQAIRSLHRRGVASWRRGFSSDRLSGADDRHRIATGHSETPENGYKQ